MSLAELQRQLAASLMQGAPAPGGCDPAAVTRTARALVRKRRDAVRRLVPALWTALAGQADAAFARHAAAYRPAGALLHIDDAWAFAETHRRSPFGPVRRAARDELTRLRLHFIRRHRRGRPAVRERRGPAAGLLRTPRLRLVWVWR